MKNITESQGYLMISGTIIILIMGILALVMSCHPDQNSTDIEEDPRKYQANHFDLESSGHNPK